METMTHTPLNVDLKKMDYETFKTFMRDLAKEVSTLPRNPLIFYGAYEIANNQVVVAIFEMQFTDEVYETEDGKPYQMLSIISSFADDMLALTHRLVAPKSTICADENPAYDGLAFHYDLCRVNHSQEYCSIDGTTNNLAESFFARFRRMIMGVYHKMGNNYMMHYANETAWREDFRYQSDKDKFDNVLKRCLKARPSRDLTGYWQGNKKPTAKFGLESLCLEASNDNQYLAVA